MKTISTAAVAALMTATLGLSAIAPTLAQEAAPPAPPPTEAPAHDTQSAVRGPGMHRGQGFGSFLSFERGAEAVEIALVRLNHRLDLTTEQQTLLDTLKTDALAAAATFESTTEALRPTAPAEGETATLPDLTERFDNRIAFQQAQVDALQSVQPAFNAFFDSLTEEQKASLTPERGDRDLRGPGLFGQRGNGPVRN